MLRINQGSIFPFRLEAKNRYSGLLYDKLKCLSSHVYYDSEYLLTALDDYYYSVTFRFYQSSMKFNRYKITNVDIVTIYIARQPITVLTNRSWHFIDY